MIILAIETSCDDTGIAVLKVKGKKSPRFELLSNIVSSQVKLHAKYGGVYPTLAKREHQRNLPTVLMQALKQSKLLKISKSEFHRPRVGSAEGGLISKPRRKVALQLSMRGKQVQNSKFKILNSILEREPELLKKTSRFLKKYQKPDIDLIAVTHGPGLEPCLWAGINFAKALAYAWDTPLAPINHIEAHVAANFVSENSNAQAPMTKQISNSVPSGHLPQGNNDQNSKQIKFPAIALVVSGGHTQLIFMEKLNQYKIIGETKDDAAGECFDKSARILGLGYPGGPAIAERARQWKSQAPITNNQTNPNDQVQNKFQIKLPRPMIYHKNYNFSFSGLKTAVLYEHKKQSPKTQTSPTYIQTMAYEIQQAIIDVLLAKTIKAAKNFQAKSIILGGGVTANRELREQFQQKLRKQLPYSRFYIPGSTLSTDNAAMVAMAGYHAWPKGIKKDWRKIKAEGNLRL